MNGVLMSSEPVTALTPDMTTLITNAFGTMQAIVTQVVGIAVVTAVSVICLTAGVNYALRKVRGVMSKAS